MNVYRIVWEDAPKNREVELLVYYRLTEGTVQVANVRPTKVMLYCPVSETLEKVLRVTRPMGKKVLTQAYLASRQGQVTLEEEIQECLRYAEGTFEPQLAL